MTTSLTAWIAAISVGLALSGAAVAQTTETTTKPETEAAESGSQAQSVEEQLSMGDEETQNPAPNQPYTAEVIGDWEMRCIKVEEGDDPCQMYQLLEDKDGTPVAEFSLFRLPEGGKAVAGATVVVPLETALPQQLNITVDGGKARRYPYAFCNQVGCYARIGLTSEDVAAFKAGNLAKLTIVPALAPDQKVILDMSLKGFTASFDKVSVITP